MNTRVAISVEEYLRTSFEDADCEYLDGEIVERNMGELPHSVIQGRLLLLLSELGSQGSLQVIPEIRIQITPTRYRVADIAVWRPGPIGSRIPTVSPFLAIEILSPEDRMVRMQPKIQEYLGIGVEWVWLIDPFERKALSYSSQNPAGVLTEALTTANPTIQIFLETLWKFLPES
ncbi:MAG: Uma2 family endonuclease [Acidobacteria bacterium]|nr:Uma2 family endonuclease [Acidobacteriota bacterium]MCI0626153.1 Uma2 family endonuclease [Acidobacteriota bacterium]MCI0724741.1 Uma2 family endonuclease [Acidobacteriota bacterium]